LVSGQTRISSGFDPVDRETEKRPEAGGESVVAALVAKLGAKLEIARELAYRRYTVCERKKRAAEALSYNGLVQSWPDRPARPPDWIGATRPGGALGIRKRSMPDRLLKIALP
jgi:hypothetical protein